MTVQGVGKSSAVRPDEQIRPGRNVPDKSGDFKKTLSEVLSNKTNLKFSNHAIDRLSDRGVNIDNNTVDRLDKAITAAGKKGADQSLVLLDEMAFLVSVKNKTIITAMETNNMKEGVITKIDSAIIG